MWFLQNVFKKRKTGDGNCFPVFCRCSIFPNEEERRISFFDVDIFYLGVDLATKNKLLWGGKTKNLSRQNRDGDLLKGLPREYRPFKNGASRIMTNLRKVDTFVHFFTGRICRDRANADEHPASGNVKSFFFVTFTPLGQLSKPWQRMIQWDLINFGPSGDSVPQRSTRPLLWTYEI